MITINLLRKTLYVRKNNLRLYSPPLACFYRSFWPMCILGIYNFQKLSIDAVPDITNVQVQINTEARGYSPSRS